MIPTAPQADFGSSSRVAHDTLIVHDHRWYDKELSYHNEQKASLRSRCRAHRCGCARRLEGGHTDKTVKSQHFRENENKQHSNKKLGLLRVGPVRKRGLRAMWQALSTATGRRFCT
jgi:hypothetical protein